MFGIGGSWISEGTSAVFLWPPYLQNFVTPSSELQCYHRHICNTNACSAENLHGRGGLIHWIEIPVKFVSTNNLLIYIWSWDHHFFTEKYHWPQAFSWPLFLKENGSLPLKIIFACSKPPLHNYFQLTCTIKVKNFRI